jgi:phage tail-like protein
MPIANETVLRPFTAFNFAVEIEVPGVATRICSAAFSECDGLEMTMEVKTIREGGANGRQIRLAGPVNYSSLILRRGMTPSFDLWDWFAATVQNPSLRGDGGVLVLGADRSVKAHFALTRCLPAKLKAPALNAKDGMVAVEELQLAYETLRLVKSTGGLRG